MPAKKKSDAGTPTFPVGKIASLLLLTTRRVQQLVKDGVIPKTERGRYELEPAVHGYIRYLQDRGSIGANTVDDAKSYYEQRARLIRLQADRAETELDELRGSLVLVDDVSEQWARLLGRMRQRILSIPSKLAPMVHHETDVAVIEAILEKAVHDVLLEFVEYADDGESEGDTTIENDSGRPSAET
jgi:phage terminase Nu1 subunit (DNA packaging protein)